MSDQGGSRHRGPLHQADEEDAVSRYWRKRMCWLQRAGAKARVKRRLRRRERRSWRKEP